MQVRCSFEFSAARKRGSKTGMKVDLRSLVLVLFCFAKGEPGRSSSTVREISPNPLEPSSISSHGPSSSAPNQIQECYPQVERKVGYDDSISRCRPCGRSQILQVWLSTAKGKGKTGEFIVGSVLRRLGPEWIIMNDLTFVMDGESTQIDHIALSRKGVFVIETKNYSGLIFGRAGEAKWTQALGRRKSSFQNPLRQNYRHLCYLADHLQLKESFLIPLVVFLGGAQFPKGRPEGVCFPNEVLDEIKAYHGDRLNNAQIDSIRLRLERLGATTRDKTNQHLDLLARR